jgi:hypothetical protein
MGYSLPPIMRSSWQKKRDTKYHVIPGTARERAALTIQLTSSNI